MKKYREALSDTEEAIELMPSSFKAIRTQARIRMALEEYEEAVRDFNRAKEALGEDGPSADRKALDDDIKKAEAALKRSKTKDYYKILGYVCSPLTFDFIGLYDLISLFPLHQRPSRSQRD